MPVALSILGAGFQAIALTGGCKTPATVNLKEHLYTFKFFLFFFFAKNVFIREADKRVQLKDARHILVFYNKSKKKQLR